MIENVPPLSENVCSTTPLNGSRKKYSIMGDLSSSMSRVCLGKRPPSSPAMPSAFSLGPDTPSAQTLNSKRHSHQASPASVQALKSAPSSTLLVQPPDCQLHITSDLHQEKTARLDVLCGPHGILKTPQFEALVNTSHVQPASMADILRVHDWSYIRHLQGKIKALEAQQQQQAHQSPMKETSADSNQATTDTVSSSSDEPPITPNLLDADTMLSVGSYRAACAAAGAVIDAVDQVANRKFKNAFVAVRPPGHHAGPMGAVHHQGFWASPQMCSSGFCLLNNVAIAAAYARYTYGRPQKQLRQHCVSESQQPPAIRRIAIIDFDIHHGNGTEAIIRNLTPHEESMPLPASWGPQTFQSYKPWLDEHDQEETFFGSVHLHSCSYNLGIGFYPCSGGADSATATSDSDSDLIVNIPLTPLGPNRDDPRWRLKLSAVQRRELRAKASAEFRAKISAGLLPKLNVFRPELVLVSAGFDGHEDDFYHHLGEEDYSWLTSQLMVVADQWAEGRLVSVLEGGYNVVAALKKESGKKTKSSTRSRSSRTKRHPSTETSTAAIISETAVAEGGEAPHDSTTAAAAGTTSDASLWTTAQGTEAEAAPVRYGALARACAAHVQALMGQPQPQSEE